MAYDVTKLPKLAALKALAEKVKNDYALKSDLDILSGRVDEIATVGGEPNVITSVLVNGKAQEVSNKAVDIIVPTKVSDLNNDSKYQTGDEVAAAIAAADHMKRKIVSSTTEIDLNAENASQYIYMVMKSSTKTSDKYDEYMVLNGALEKVGDWEVDLSNYVKKDGNKVLSSNDFTNELLQKLNGISAGANNYIHAKHEAHASGLYKVTIDEEGHVTAVATVTKTDIVSLGIPESDTTYMNATTKTDGLMSKTDKVKLDGMVLATDTEVTEMLNAVFAKA